MKKILSSLLVLILCFGLFGCGGDKGKTTVCKMGEGTNNENIVTFKSEGDKISTAEYEITTNFAVYGYTSEQIQTSVDTTKAKYAIDGLDYKGEIVGDVLVETIKVDYNKANMEELLALKIVISVDGSVPKFVSLKSTVDDLVKNNNAVCTEK